MNMSHISIKTVMAETIARGGAYSLVCLGATVTPVVYYGTLHS